VGQTQSSGFKLLNKFNHTLRMFFWGMVLFLIIRVLQ